MTKKLFLFFILFFLLFGSYSFATDLEINYPVLTIGPGAGTSITAQTTVPQYLKYVFDISFFIGFLAVFLSLFAAGVLYLLSPALPNAQGIAKDRFSGAISGLLILITLYLIITTINPALSVFRTTPLSKVPEFPPLPPPPGVAFYKSPNCPAPDPGLATGSLPILGNDLINNIRSAKIIKGYDTYFVSILYENPKFRGKCFYVDPNIGCASPNNNIEPFAVSASIDRFSWAPFGNVVFYRNAFSGASGGYFVVDSSIVQAQGGIYLGKLDNLKFTGASSQCTVPIKEQDCEAWSETLCQNCVIIDGKFCSQTKCPTLAGHNIGSIEINGSYIVLFIYFDPQDKRKGPWSFCQAFPSPDDVNKTGPQQIKWEDILNNNLGKTPNWVAIIPVVPTNK